MSVSTSLESPRPGRLLSIFLLAFAFARTILALTRAWDFTTDDAYITARYARHLAEGHGLVWNLGEPPVEGYSNFLFVLLGALSIELGGDPILVFKLAGCLALGATCLVLYLLARQWLGPVAATIPPLLLTAYEGAILWSVSGLETSVYQLVVLAAVTTHFRGLGFRSEGQTIRASRNRAGEADTTPAGVAVANRVIHEPQKYSPQSTRALRLLAFAGTLTFVASITRPEGPVVAMLLLVALFVRSTTGSGLRGAVTFGLTFGVPYLVYSVWHLSHFGRLWPNSVYCKAQYGGDPMALAASFLPIWFPLMLLSVLHTVRRLDVRHLVLWGLPIAYLLLLYGVDPIVGQWNRHFLTPLAVALVAASVGAVQLVSLVVRWVPKGFGNVALGALILLGSGLLTERASARAEAEAVFYAQRMDARRQLGQWLKARARPDDWIAIGDAGLVPYLVEARFLDVYCLNCAEMTTSPSASTPAGVAALVFARMPRFLVVHSTMRDRLVPHSFYGAYPAIVKHPRFSENYAFRATAGAPQDTYWYWVFERRPGLPG